MYLRDYLHDIPLKALKAIADSLNVKVEYQARIKLINAIDRAFWDGTLVKRFLTDLSDDHQRLVSFIAFSGDVGVTEKALLKKVERILGIRERRTHILLDDLLSRCLVGGIAGAETIYFCPRGVAEQVRFELINDVVDIYNESAPVPMASSPNLMEDIFSFLALAYTEGISFTLMGRIKKAFLERAFEGSPTCANSAIHFSEEHRNAFIVNYLQKRGLVSFDVYQNRSIKNLHGWLELSMTERFQDIVSLALEHTLQDEYTILAFTCIMFEIPAGSRLNVRKLAYFLHANTMAPGGFSRLESRIRDILNILNQLGLFFYSKNTYVLTSTGERFFRNGSLPLDDNISGSFIVQPNFEVIVGPELDPRVRFKLELLASRKNRDMVLTYLITQKGINRAREQGMSTRETIAFFKRHSKTSLPQNVQFSIESWANAYGSIYFENAVLMRFRDTDTCNAIAHMTEIQPYLKEQLSDTCLIVSSGDIQKISSILKDAGYQPEVYGQRINNVAYNDKFVISTIGEMYQKKRIPELHNKFFFPEHLLINEGSK